MENWTYCMSISIGKVWNWIPCMENWTSCMNISICSVVFLTGLENWMTFSSNGLPYFVPKLLPVTLTKDFLVYLRNFRNCGEKFGLQLNLKQWPLQNRLNGALPNEFWSHIRLLATSQLNWVHYINAALNRCIIYSHYWANWVCVAIFTLTLMSGYVRNLINSDERKAKLTRDVVEVCFFKASI